MEAVLVTGGTSSSTFNDGTNAVYAAEMWNPDTGLWSTMASAKVKRLYHSTALLLPDGRVISAGGGKPPPTNGSGSDNYNVEIYSPPYLFTGVRPTIKTSPASIAYDTPFQVTTDAADITTSQPGAVGFGHPHLRHESAHQIPEAFTALPNPLGGSILNIDYARVHAEDARSSGSLHAVHRQQQRRAFGGEDCAAAPVRYRRRPAARAFIPVGRMKVEAFLRMAVLCSTLLAL